MGRIDNLPLEAREFLNYCEAIHNKTTLTTYTTSLLKFYTFLKKKFPEEENLLRKIDRPICEEWFAELFHSGLAKASRFLALMNVRCYLNWALDRGYLNVNPRELIRVSDFPKRPQYLPKPLEPDHDQKLQEYLKTSSNLTYKGLLLLRYTGMRVGELIKMPFDCLHQEEDRTFSIKVPLGKLNNERLVPLTQEAVEVIRKIQNHTNKERFNLMTKTNGVVVSHSGMRSAMNRACIKTGIPHYCVHQLRHTFATSILNGGASLVVIMRLLGHKRFSMTLRYAQVTQETIRREYFNAINKTTEQYDIKSPYEETISNPLVSFADLIRLLEKKRQESSDPKSDKEKLQLLKRLRRLEDELKKIL